MTKQELTADFIETTVADRHKKARAMYDARQISHKDYLGVLDAVREWATERYKDLRERRR